MARSSLVLAMVLSGRMASAACGDGVPDPGEDCDDGNVAAGDCCSATCTFEPAGSPCPDDRNPCSLDECDPNGICTHPTGGQASCDDGDPCTADDVCDAGVCAGGFVLDGCIDAVQCRRSRRESGFDSTPVGVDDQSALFLGTVGRPHDLCLSASTTGTPPIDPDAALVNLKLRVKAAFRSGTWHVSDRFGELDVETRRADRLLVATATDASGPPASPPPPGSANHYACRKVRLRSDFPRGLVLTVDDELGSAQRAVLKPDRLCSATDVGAPGTGMRHPRAHLMCYTLANHGDRTALLDVHTANQLGAGEVLAFGAEELCVPARADEAPSPCLTGGDECGLPCCRVYPVQHADCTFSPAVASPRYRGCSGPLVLVDASHANFHEVTPGSARYPGRLWGFAKLLVRDGYVVRDSTVPFAELLPTTSAKIIVVANPRPLQGPEAVSAADIAALLTWVGNGGSLLLSIDHSPYDHVDALLTALGLVHPRTDAPEQTFTRTAGLNPASMIANGSGPGEAIDEVTTFVGTAFGIAPIPPSQASYEPVLTFPPGSKRSIEGLLQGVTIEFGAGRVYVSGESGGLTAQVDLTTQDPFGMQVTPDNAQYVLNIVHWLDY